MTLKLEDLVPTCRVRDLRNNLSTVLVLANVGGGRLGDNCHVKAAGFKGTENERVVGDGDTALGDIGGAGEHVRVVTRYFGIGRSAVAGDVDILESHIQIPWILEIRHVPVNRTACPGNRARCIKRRPARARATAV